MVAAEFGGGRGGGGGSSILVWDDIRCTGSPRIVERKEGRRVRKRQRMRVLEEQETHLATAFGFDCGGEAASLPVHSLLPVGKYSLQPTQDNLKISLSA